MDGGVEAPAGGHAVDRANDVRAVLPRDPRHRRDRLALDRLDDVRPAPGLGTTTRSTPLAASASTRAAIRWSRALEGEAHDAHRPADAGAAVTAGALASRRKGTTPIIVRSVLPRAGSRNGSAGSGLHARGPSGRRCGAMELGDAGVGAGAVGPRPGLLGLRRRRVLGASGSRQTSTLSSPEHSTAASRTSTRPRSTTTARSEWWLSTRCAGSSRPHHDPLKVSPARVEPDVLPLRCEASLRRLSTDCIDLFLVHWPVTLPAIRHFTRTRPRTGGRRRLRGPVRLQEQGKVRHISVRDHSLARLTRRRHSPGSSRTSYHGPALARDRARASAPAASPRGVGVIGYMATLQGVLSDGRPTLDDVPPWQRRTRHFDAAKAPGARHGLPGKEAAMRVALTGLRALCRELGRPLSEVVALAWTIAELRDRVQPGRLAQRRPARGRPSAPSGLWRPTRLRPARRDGTRRGSRSSSIELRLLRAPG